MSWAVDIPQATPAWEAKERIAAEPIPQPVKDYVALCIDGIIDSFNDENIRVTITGNGHICAGSGSQAASFASINVSPSTAGV